MRYIPTFNHVEGWSGFDHFANEVIGRAEALVKPSGYTTRQTAIRAGYRAVKRAWDCIKPYSAIPPMITVSAEVLP